MITFFRRAGLGTKLSLLTGASVATLFLLFTFLLSHNASQQLEDLAVEDLHNQSTGMVDMVEMFNTSLSEEVESYTRLFTTFLPQPLNSDSSQSRTINGLTVPLLKGGETELHENNTLSDDFLSRTGAISTLFVRSGNDFIRVATSLRKENGDRAIGTVLDTTSPAFAAVTKGRSIVASRCCSASAISRSTSLLKMRKARLSGLSLSAWTSPIRGTSCARKSLTVVWARAATSLY